MQNISGTVQWSSDTPAVATISNAAGSQGVASSAGQGTATITASVGTVSGSTTLTVTSAALFSLAITPVTPALALGTTQPFTATGTFTDGSTENLTSTVIWSSDTLMAATINSVGVASSVGIGTATITATSGSILASTVLTVTPAVLVSIAINPPAAAIPLGLTQPFTAAGTFSDGTTQDVTQSGHWSSTVATVATISNSAGTAGLATTLGTGTTTIGIRAGGVSAAVPLVVNPIALASIAITPQTPTMARGPTQPFTATGTYTDGSTQDVTSVVTWSSSDATVAIISNGVGSYGLATSSGQGTATITATSTSLTSSTTITVGNPALVSIAISPVGALIPLGTSQLFTATGTYSNGSTQNLSGTVQWTSSAISVATVSSGGLATGIAQGATTITASTGAISSSVAMTVTAPVLTSIAISPGSASIAKGTSQQFMATGTYSDGNQQNLSSTVSWSSSPTTVASIATSGLATGAGVGSATIMATSGSISGLATLSVGQPVLVSMAVTPANPSFALGTTQPLAATGTYSDGSTLDLTSLATWSTADGTIATVNGQGLATSIALGSTSVTASSGLISGSTTLTVTPAILVSIAVTPAIPAIPLGTTQPFTATGTYSDGSMQNISGTVQWSSDTPAVATISNAAGSQGVASSAGQGTATITASVGTVSGSTTLTVTSAALFSLAITPVTPALALGTTQPFTATGTFTDGSTENLTSTVIWSSDTLMAATINSVGVASSVGIGTATITATSGSILASTVLTVTPAVLVSIAIKPPAAAIPLGLTQPFTAAGTFSDGTTQDVTQSGHWSSTVATVATISNSAGTAGLAATLGAGTTTIGISAGGVSAAGPLVVNPIALASIAITPQTPTIALGTTQPFTATGTYTDGSTQDVTSVVTWSSSDATVAIISNGVGSYGLATSSGQGTATITATSTSLTSSTTITVGNPALVSIAISPVGALIPLGTSQLFTATGTYTDGSTQDVTASVTWASDSPAVAPVSASGMVMGSALGTANISASSGTVASSTGLGVTAPLLLSIAISPGSASIAKGTSQQFMATGTYSDGSQQNLSSTVSWSSSPTTVASIATSGLATGAGVGSATIMATSGSISGLATLSVGQPVLVSMAVPPANPSFALGTTQPLAATGTYSDGSTLDLTSLATWSTADGTIATVNGQGLATSIALGSTSVTASSGLISGSTTLTVTPAILVSIAVTPAIPAIPLGTTQPFTATGTYSDGSMQNISGTVQWSSDTPAVATISNAAGSQGVASSAGQGTATITASVGTVSGSTTLTVTSAALFSLAITPVTPALALGTTQPFTATGTFTDGSTQNLTSTVIWSSDTLTTATINSVGVASSVGIGTATITATSGSILASTVLTVTPAVLVSIAINPPAAAIPLGLTQPFTAAGTFSDGTTQDVTQSGHWSSTVATVATISNSAGTAGLATTLGTGTTTIGISSGGVSAAVPLVVNPIALASIAITPQTPTIALGTTQPFTATGTYTDGSTQDVISVVTWISSDATVGIISNGVGSYGLATSSGQGTATITATSTSLTSSTTITVGNPALVSIAISPVGALIPLGTSQLFTATGTYTDGSTQDVTASVVWASDSPAIAPVTAGGLVTGTAMGTANISASSGTVTNSTSVAVT